MIKPKYPVSVLRGGDKASNSVSPVAASTCTDTGKGTTCEQSVSECALLSVRKQLEQLYTANSPDIHNRVLAYLDAVEGADAQLVAAWGAYGRRDRQRTVDLRLNDVAKRTISPLGFACLISYARAWVDEAEAIALKEKKRVASCFGSAGSAPKCPPLGSTRLPRARVAVASKRRKRPA
jgi:hypothetical protein